MPRRAIRAQSRQSPRPRVAREIVDLVVGKELREQADQGEQPFHTPVDARAPSPGGAAHSLSPAGYVSCSVIRHSGSTTCARGPQRDRRVTDAAESCGRADHRIPPRTIMPCG